MEYGLGAAIAELLYYYRYNSSSWYIKVLWTLGGFVALIASLVLIYWIMKTYFYQPSTTEVVIDKVVNFLK